MTRHTDGRLDPTMDDDRLMTGTDRTDTDLTDRTDADSDRPY